MFDKKSLANGAIGSAHATLTFLVATTFSWMLLASFNFLYGIWHDHGGIGEGIAKYGPQNRFKPGFADTSKAEREVMFAQINQAIHRGGKGLKEIAYQSKSSQGQQRLLHRAEIIHLKDVANLISFLKVMVIFVFAGWIFSGFLLYKRTFDYPPIWRQMVKLVISILVIAAVIIVIGAEGVFNQLHIWVFPKGHQWFFYYQESLMSTMMLAPTLFGYIAVALVVVALPFFIVCHLVLERILVRYVRFK